MRSNLFLIADNASPEALDNVKQFLDERRVPAVIIERQIQQAGYRVGGARAPRLKLSTYTRLHLDEYFDDDWDRVLYLDADVRVISPLRALLDVELRGSVLGAAIQDKGSELRPYFNAGVLLFDWRSVLSSELLKETRRFALENPDLCRWVDQDALNWVFRERWTPIDRRWNVINSVARQYPYWRPHIKHPTTRDKPWLSTRRPHMLVDGIWYWRVLRNSPWPDFAGRPTVKHVMQAAKWHWANRNQWWHPARPC